MNRQVAAMLTTASGLALATPVQAQSPVDDSTTTAAPVQDPTQEGGSTAAADSGPVINDIIVTAQRREERLQNVPIAITAFSAEDVLRNDVRDVSRLSQFAAGFNFGQSGFDFRPAIRGVRNETVDVNPDPSVGFYIDDIYQSLSVQASQPFVDVERVEVQRGPQGTLFGRNTFGGSVAVINALPGEELEGGFDLTYGNYERIKFTGFASVPIAEGVGIRIAAAREKRDGFVKNVPPPTVSFCTPPFTSTNTCSTPVGRPGNDLNDRDTDYLRGTLRIAPSDSFEAVFRGTYWKEGGTGAAAYGWVNRGVIADPNVSGNAANPNFRPVQPRGRLDGVPIFNFFGGGRLRDGVIDINGQDIGIATDPRPYTWSGEFRPVANLKNYAGSAQLRWSNDNIFIRSITSYTDFKYDSNTGEAIGSPLTEYIQIRNVKSFTQELQLGGVETKPFQWIVGLYYLNDKNFDSFVINQPGYYYQSIRDLKTDSYAAYAQASYYFSDVLRVTAGGRYTSDQKEFVSTSFDTFEPDYGTLDQEDKFERFTWRLGVEAFLNPRHMLYASVSTGFRSGGFNGASTTNPNLSPTFDTERVTAYEIGSKNQFWGGRAQVNLSAYYNDFTDLQLQNQFSLPNSTVSSSGVLNAGSARAYGLEVESLFRPMRELTLNATASILNARFTDYSFVGRPSAFYPIQPIDLSGNRIGHMPFYKFTVGAAYDFVIPGFGTITPRGSAVISGKYYNTDYNTVLDLQRAYETYDASLGWTSEDGRLGLEGFVTNLTNKAVLNYAAFGSQTLLANFEQPRFYGVRFTFRSE